MDTDTVQIFVMNDVTSSDNIDELEIKCADESQVNPENVQEITNICRICATVTDLVIHIFDGEGLQNNLADKIHKHLPIKVSVQDILPRVVCYQCSSTLLAWHELVQCCQQADTALRQSVANRDKKANESLTEMKSDPKWPPPGEFYRSERRESDVDPDDRTDVTDAGSLGSRGGPDGDEDDEPLAALAAGRPSEAYRNFCRALENFRDHFVKHQKNRSRRSDFSDSSEAEEVRRSPDPDPNRFDDLTSGNMRKDKMDERTRLELSQVRTEIDGKTYFACGICDKKLSSSHTYVFHRRIHTGERPCVCHVCGKQFRAPGGLARHVAETHERARRPACAACHRSFANSQNLKQHMRIHSGERPYECALCGKRFTQSGSLHAHRGTHAARAPHACRDCGARFRLRSVLARHRLLHSGERPHACTHCGKAFRQRHELNAHASIHSDGRPHACDVCGAAFRQRRALREHRRRLHADRPADAAPLYGQTADYVLTLDSV